MTSKPASRVETCAFRFARIVTRFKILLRYPRMGGERDLDGTSHTSEILFDLSRKFLLAHSRMGEACGVHGFWPLAIIRIYAHTFRFSHELAVGVLVVSHTVRFSLAFIYPKIVSHFNRHYSKRV